MHNERQAVGGLHHSRDPARTAEPPTIMRRDAMDIVLAGAILTVCVGGFLTLLVKINALH